MPAMASANGVKSSGRLAFEAGSGMGNDLEPGGQSLITTSTTLAMFCSASAASGDVSMVASSTGFSSSEVSPGVTDCSSAVAAGSAGGVVGAAAGASAGADVAVGAGATTLGMPHADSATMLTNRIHRRNVFMLHVSLLNKLI